MATSAPHPSDNIEDTNNNNYYINYINNIRASIQQHYSSLIDAIRQSKNQLLQELDSIEQTYICEYQKCQTTIVELEKTKQQTLANLSSDDMKDLRDNMVKQMDEKIKSIQTKIEYKNISFEWDTNLANKVSMIGKLIVTPANSSIDYKKKVNPILTTCKQGSGAGELNYALGVATDTDTNLANKVSLIGKLITTPANSSIDYKKKVYPILTTCKQGSGTGELNYAWGVATDTDTNNIYVVDHHGSRLCVFSSEGEFLFQFSGNTNNTVNMSNPIGIAIYENKVFVNQRASHCIQIYNLNGTYIQQFGSQGSGKDQLNRPYGIAISPSYGNIYVCDFLNNRIQIFSRDYKHKSFLGVDHLKFPRDVKLAQQEIIILDDNTLCVHLYDYDNNLLKSIISKTGNGYIIRDACCIYVDRDNNIILSDFGGGVVLIFSSTGEIIHQIGNTANMFTHPQGVMVDTLGRLIVVSQQPDACIQIF